MAGDINSNLNTEKLINLIKNRPALYDKTLLGYTDRPLKQKLWLEICEQMTPGWMYHNLNAKVQIGTKVQKKWQEIRSSFQKELNLQKVGHLLGKCSNRRNKYRYFDNLSFLLPTMNLELPPSGIQVHNVEATDVPTTTNSHHTSQTSGKNLKRKQPDKEPYLKIFNIQSNKEIDEDKHFLLSIVPSLQRMTPTQKIRAKMMFLQAIHDIEEESQRTPCPQFVINELGNHQARPFGSTPTSCTTTSDVQIISDPQSITQSSQNVILSSPRLIESLPCQIQSSQSLIQTTPRLIQSPPSETHSSQSLVQCSQSLVQSSSILIQSPPRLVQSPPRLVQSPPSQLQSPPIKIENLPSIMQNPSAIKQSPPRITLSPPKVIQSSQSPAPQQANQNHVAMVWIKDNSLLFEEPPMQPPNSFKDEIIIDDD